MVSAVNVDRLPTMGVDLGDQVRNMAQTLETGVSAAYVNWAPLADGAWITTERLDVASCVEAMVDCRGVMTAKLTCTWSVEARAVRRADDLAAPPQASIDGTVRLISRICDENSGELSQEDGRLRQGGRDRHHAISVEPSGEHLAVLMQDESSPDTQWQVTFVDDAGGADVTKFALRDDSHDIFAAMDGAALYCNGAGCREIRDGVTSERAPLELEFDSVVNVATSDGVRLVGRPRGEPPHPVQQANLPCEAG